MATNQPAEHATYSAFISHSISDSDLANSVARALPIEGIRGYVATYHLPDAREWLPNLEHELRHCDALLAMLSPGFRDSDWTDQEVGYVLARRRKVVPLLLGEISLPHGFLGQLQGVQIAGLGSKAIARRVFDALFTQPDEQPRLLPTVLRKLQAERDQSRITVWVSRLEQVRKFTDADLRSVEHALATNSVIRHNVRTARRVSAVIDRTYT